MATLNEIVSNIRNIIKERSDDSKLSNSQIIHLINYCREELIRRDYENKRAINPQIEQSLGCWELELVDKAECCELDTGCPILKTKVQLPQFVEVYQDILLTYIGSIDGDTDFQLISAARNRWTKYERYTSKLPKALIKNNYLYVTGDLAIEVIKLRGILQDPRIANNYINCDTGKICFNAMTDQYPITGWMERAVVDMLRRGELDMYFRSLQDKTNDNDDDKEPNTQAN